MREGKYLALIATVLKAKMASMHTFPGGEMQHRVAEFCYCLYLEKRTHSFHFPLVARKAKGVGRTLE